MAGRYVLEREIARGGMGAVWLGRDTVLDRVVALKRVGMVPGGSTPDLARAEREARLAAALSHPHVVAVFDLVADGPEHWLVMEYVPGASLAEVIRRDGPLPAERAAALLAQTADALTAAHGVGIVHRDVKPSNILVTAQDEAKLTDFGIARAEADASLTQTGLVTGSPAYLSPEVASGSSATPASDVWALGATLFHALAGRPPYDASDNVLGAMYQIVHETPPRLPDAGWLGPLLEHTMATDPADRWSMTQVRDFLHDGEQRAVPGPTRTLPAVAPQPAPSPGSGSGYTTAVPPVTSGTTAPRARSRWPVLAAFVALLAVGVLAFSVGLLSSAEEDQDPPSAQTTGAPEASPVTGSPSASTSPSASATPASSAEVAQEMESFVADYLSTVTQDPKTSWQQLTPEFQKASGGFGQYKNFWRTVAAATVSQVQADPESSTVTYTVTYDMVDGGQRTDNPTLKLLREGSGYKILSEA
ncbi:serine/threonine-protein kinase [Nocardioides houyundeii]|uniref:serine/threonine-protein kinase n=1 Tax=Nocardioides houyundeii TaxID=2045452 RepID=UPI001F53DB5F|nr:serine/threonine-protein kinase [Nocardioides houyundeii]